MLWSWYAGEACRERANASTDAEDGNRRLPEYTRRPIPGDPLKLLTVFDGPRRSNNLFTERRDGRMLYGREC